MTKCSCGTIQLKCPIHDVEVPKPEYVFPPNYNLTPSETEIRDLLIKGLTNTEIAQLMNTTSLKIGNLMRKIYKKYRCSSRAEVIATHFGLR